MEHSALLMLLIHPHIMIMILILYMIHNLYIHKYIIYYTNAERNAKSDDVYHHIVILCSNKHYLYGDDDLSRFSIH